MHAVKFVNGSTASSRCVPQCGQFSGIGPTAMCQNSGLNCGDSAAITATQLETCRPIPLTGQPRTPTGCSLESAILVTLPPGNYTAQVSGGIGVGLVEVFEVVGGP